jgi:hypothetical protein
MGRNRSSGSMFRGMVGIGAVVALLWIVWIAVSHWIAPSEETAAAAAVEKFYRLEKAGDYGSSWEMFHSQMKERFAKDGYIQRRAHVFMQDFQADSFQYELEAAVREERFRMADGMEELYGVYRIPVKLTFLTVFGRFELLQECYAAEENGEWKLLWSYEPLKE